MSGQTAPQNGQNIEREFTPLFDLARVEVSVTAESKPIIAKLSPKTDVWAMVKEVNKTLPHLKPTGIIRLLIRVGYAAFVKSERARGVRE